MLASIKHNGLKMTMTPGLTWDSERSIFKGSVLYGDEVLTLCVAKERMRLAINAAFDTNGDIEPLFDPEEWIVYAEHPHDREVYFEEEEELGPDPEA